MSKLKKKKKNNNHFYLLDRKFILYKFITYKLEGSKLKLIIYASQQFDFYFLKIKLTKHLNF